MCKSESGAPSRSVSMQRVTSPGPRPPRALGTFLERRIQRFFRPRRRRASSTWSRGRRCRGPPRSWPETAAPASDPGPIALARAAAQIPSTLSNPPPVRRPSLLTPTSRDIHPPVGAADPLIGQFGLKRGSAMPSVRPGHKKSLPKTASCNPLCDATDPGQPQGRVALLSLC